MNSIISRPFFYLGSFIACSVMAFTTGCASGGFKLTRQYSGFVNRQPLILRIVLYILTSIVFAATLLIDAVVFNTMDFWEGRVSQGTFEFEGDGKVFHARHELQPETNLRRSTIRVMDQNKNLIQEVVLLETPSNEIEMFVDGKLRTKVRDIHSLPVASIFDSNGGLMEEKLILNDTPAQNVAMNTQLSSFISRK